MDWKQQDLEGMKNPSPDKWPLYPILPLKNYKRVPAGRSPLHAVIVAWDKKPLVYLDANVAQLAGEHLHTVEHKDVNGRFGALEIVGENLIPEEYEELKLKLSALKTEEFPTFEALQEAGWDVD